MKRLEFKMTEFHGRPAVEFKDGTVVFQSESLGEFLRTCDMLTMGGLPEELILDAKRR